MWKRLGLFFAAVFAAGWACGAEPQWQFKDVTSKVVDRNPPGLGRIFDYAFVDINDDNYLDIVVNNHLRSKLAPVWLGTAEHTFRFWRNMPEANMPIAGFYLAEADLNGDGRTDLIYTGNEGGVVANLNRQSRAAHPTFQPQAIPFSSKQVALADFTGDDKLEVLVRPGRMFDNTLKITVRSDLQFGEYTVSDFDADGWPDLFACGVASRRKSWSGPRKLFRNVQGSLQSTGEESPLLKDHFGGLARTGDFNNDGHMDLYVFDSKSTSGSEGNHRMRLYLGNGKFGFTDVSELAGIANAKLKSGYSMVYLADINNDTHLDIVNQSNYGCRCWRNDGNARFTLIPKVEAPWAVNAHMRFDDFDMDGRLDIVTAAEGPGWKDRERTLRVFRNEISNGNQWLKIQLRQDGHNTMAIGASVTIFQPGTRIVLGKRIVLCDSVGYHPRLHFGLGKHRLVDVEVRFPRSSEVVRFPRMASNRYVVLKPGGESSDVGFGANSE